MRVVHIGGMIADMVLLSNSQSEIVSPIHHRLKPMAETQNQPTIFFLAHLAHLAHLIQLAEETHLEKRPSSK
jgi:hypothetical protein